MTISAAERLGSCLSSILTPNTTGGVRDTAGSLIIGAQLAEKYNAGYGNLGWDGVIDRVIIRSDTLSAGQVQARYDSL